jgi:hypothetical protein
MVCTGNRSLYVQSLKIVAMSEEVKKPAEQEPEVVRKPIVPDVPVESDEGSRSPKNDRDLTTEIIAEAPEETEVVRKPIIPDVSVDSEE